MKKLVFGLLAATVLGSALPAAAQVVVRERHNGTVVVRPAHVIHHDRYYGHHHRHRVVWYDRFHHRHVEWR